MRTMRPRPRPYAMWPHRAKPVTTAGSEPFSLNGVYQDLPRIRRPIPYEKLIKALVSSAETR